MSTSTLERIEISGQEQEDEPEVYHAYCKTCHPNTLIAFCGWIAREPRRYTNEDVEDKDKCDECLWLFMLHECDE